MRRIVIYIALFGLLAGCTGGTPAATGDDWPELRLVDPNGVPRVLQEGSTPADIQLSGSDFDFATLAELQGKRVFMTFWNTWCPYCREVLPQYDQLRIDLAADDIVWMFVNNVPAERDGTPAQIEAYVAELGLTTPIVLDRTGEVALAYGARGVPTTAVLDADGAIVVIFPGAAPYDLAKLALDYAADPSVLDNLVPDDAEDGTGTEAEGD